MKIKNYWFAGILLGCALPVAAIISGYLYEDERAAETEIVHEQHLMQAVVENLRERLVQAEKLITISADFLGTTGTQDKTTLQSFLKDFYEACSEFLNVHYDDLDGTAIAFYPPKNIQGDNNIGVNHSSQPHWQTMRLNSATHISDIFRGTGATNRIIANVSSSAYDPSGKLIGYAVAALNLDDLARRLSMMTFQKDFDIVLTDSTGTAVYADSRAATNLKKVFTPQELEDARRTPDPVNFKFVTTDGEEYPGLINYIPETCWYVGLIRTSERSTDKSKKIERLLVWCIPLLTLLLAYIISRIFARPIASSLSKLRDQVETASPVITTGNKISFPEELAETQKLVAEAFREDEFEVPLSKEKDSQQRPLIMKIMELRNLNSAWINVFTEMRTGVALIDDSLQLRQVNTLFSVITGYESEINGKLDPELAKEFKSNGISLAAAPATIKHQFQRTGILARCSILPVNGQDPALYLLALKILDNNEEDLD